MENVVIDVKDATVQFNLASEKVDNIKEYFIKLVKHELMFQEFLALKNISFQVKKGEAWGIVGSNGSGKSTLLKLISGILTPYKGEVHVNGRIAPLIELGAGLDMNLTARENIYLDGCLLGHSKKFMEEHFDEIVDFAELEEFLDVPLKNYSSGMQARIGFAIATMVQPEILIVDEILSVGDYHFQQKSMKRMKKMLDNGATLLFVSHSIDDIRRMCDHAIWINNGEMMMCGDVSDVCDAYLASQMAKTEGEDFKSPIWTEQRYLMATYNNHIMKMKFMRSDDGTHFTSIGDIDYKLQLNDKTVRDPSFIKIGEFYYIVYTAIGWGKGNYIGMCRTRYYSDFEELPSIYIGKFEKIWSPYIFKEDKKIYIIINACEKHDDDEEDIFDSYIMEYDVYSHSVLGEKKIEGLPRNVLDSRVYKINNEYILFYKNEISKYIEVAKSKDICGPYKICRTGNWAKWGNHLGGPSLVRTEKGKYRLYMEDYTINQLYYSEAEDLFGEWSSKKKISLEELSHPEVKVFDNVEKKISWDAMSIDNNEE